MVTNETTVILAAFVLGVVTGWVLRKSHWWLRREIKKMIPLRCPQCGKWLSSVSMVGAHHRTAGWTRLCPDCHKALYNPFTEEEDDGR